MVNLAHIEPGDTVNAQLAVRDNRGIKPYADGHLLTLVLGNATGQITAKLWLGPSKDRARELARRYETGTVLNVHANATEYRGSPELSLQEPPSTVDPDTIQPSAFIPGSDRHLGFLLRSVLERARSIDEDPLRELTVQAWSNEETQNKIAEAPASKRNHRAHRGGLLERVHALLALSDALIATHSNLDEDLLTAAILLHPLGSLDEHRVTAAITITDEGRLLGPGLLTDERLRGILEDAPLPMERAVRLRHALLVLSGAGVNVNPRTPEAVAARWIERLDARLTRTLEAADRMHEEGQRAGWAPETKAYLDIKARRIPGEAAQERATPKTTPSRRINGSSSR